MEFYRIEKYGFEYARADSLKTIIYFAENMSR